MKTVCRIMLGLGALAIVAGLSAPAEAQCLVPQLFGATGDKGSAGRIFIATAANGFPTDGNEEGSLWERGNPSNNNAGPHFGAGPATCDCLVGQNWCRQTPSNDLSIFGNLSSTGCTTPQCQEEKTFVFVVEDRNDDDTDAGFIVYQIDWSTSTVRAFDHARTANPAPMALTTHTMERFPTVNVQSSSGPPPNTTLTNSYANVTINHHGVTGGAANTPVDAPDEAGGAIAAYDVCTFRGTADPGRARTAWSCDQLDQVDYDQINTEIGDTFSVPCPDTDLDTFVAVGIEYVDGVKSVLVGESTAVECNPTIAEPEPRKQDRLGVRGRNRMTR